MSLNQRTRIDWADFTWNPVWGCRGTCSYCYARRMAHRFGLQVAGREDFAPTWIERNFRRPLPRQPARIFVNSMSDLADWEPGWFQRVNHRIRGRTDHLFLFLSKRPWRCQWDAGNPNAMLGYSVTCAADLETLARHGRPVDFLSVEPLLGEIRIPIPLLAWRPRWIIVGAETGNRRERVVPEVSWLREIFDYCQQVGIPLFFKGSLLHLWPHAYFPQEYPTP